MYSVYIQEAGLLPLRVGLATEGQRARIDASKASSHFLRTSMGLYVLHHHRDSCTLPCYHQCANNAKHAHDIPEATRKQAMPRKERDVCVQTASEHKLVHGSRVAAPKLIMSHSGCSPGVACFTEALERLKG